MNLRLVLFSPWLFATLYCHVFANVSAAETVEQSSVDDFFAMSPAELANIPIVSLATGTPKPLSQTASVVSVISAEQIKAMGAIELHEILETVPGFHASLQAGQYDWNYSVRGMTNATNSQILMLLNGTRINIPFSGSTLSHFEMPIEAIQRVEVLRGPASAVYGADAFAGVVNIVTKKASNIAGKTLGVRVGNWNSHSTWGQLGGQVAGWAVASSVQYQYTDGDPQRRIQGDAQSALDRTFATHASLAPSAMNTRYETLNGHLNLQRSHWDINFWGFTQLDGGLYAGAGNALDTSGKSHSSQYLADVHFSSENWFDNWELQARLSYLYTDFSMQARLLPNGTKVGIDKNGTLSPTTDAIAVSFPQGVQSSIGRNTQMPMFEFNSLYKGLNGHLLRFIAGLRYESIAAQESKNFGQGVIDINDISGIKNPSIDGKLTNVTGTPFVYLPDSARFVGSLAIQDEWQLTNAWQLTAGVRYDEYSDFGSTINPRAALVWSVNDKFSAKLLYGKAFRAPSFSEQNYQNNPAYIGGKHLKPETINTLETVFDYHPNTRFRTALNLFTYQIAGLIVALPDFIETAKGGMATGSYTYQNYGNHQGYGMELEWDWQIYSTVSLLGNYAWQEAYKISTNSPAPSIPNHHIYAALGWQLTPQWLLRPQVNWIASRYSFYDDMRSLSDYETVDLTLRGKKLLGYLNVSASVHNLFDSINREPAESNFSQNLPLAGRSFYIEAAINF